MVKKKKKWFGLKTEYSQQEYQVQEEREADLRFNLDAKYLPVIYGVGKVSGIPVFVDTLNTDASMIIQQKLDLSGNATARTFCVNACNLALGRDISGSLLTDSEITDYESNNLVYLGSNDVNVQKTFLSSNILWLKTPSLAWI